MRWARPRRSRPPACRCPPSCASRCTVSTSQRSASLDGCVDDLCAGRPLGHHLRRQQRDDRAGEADDRREREQLAVLHAGRRRTPRGRGRSTRSTMVITTITAMLVSRNRAMRFMDAPWGVEGAADDSASWRGRHAAPCRIPRARAAWRTDAGGPDAAQAAARPFRRPAGLGPGVLQRDGAVVDRPAGRVVGEVGDEIAVPLELEARLGRRRGERRLDVGGDDPLRVRVEVVEVVALDHLGSASSSPATTTALGRRVGLDGGGVAPRAPGIACAGKRHAEQPVVQAHLGRRRAGRATASGCCP